VKARSSSREGGTSEISTWKGLKVHDKQKGGGGGGLVRRMDFKNPLDMGLRYRG